MTNSTNEEMQTRVALWDAINQYVWACGGDPALHVHGNTARQRAVVAVEQVVFPAGTPVPSARPRHYVEVGCLCPAWEGGDADTADRKLVTCADCREHFAPDSPEEGIRSTRFGEECPKCGEDLPTIDDGDTGACPACAVVFLRVDLPSIHVPMPPDAARSTTVPPGGRECPKCSARTYRDDGVSYCADCEPAAHGVD